MWIVFVVVILPISPAQSEPGDQARHPGSSQRKYELFSVAEWTERLKSGVDDDVKRQSAIALGKIGAEAKAAVPVLMRAVSDESIWVRIEAARALGKIGPEAKVAVPVLILALDDFSQPLDYRPRFERDTAPAMREAALEALSEMGHDAEAALPNAIAGLRDPSPIYRSIAVNAVMRLATDGPSRLVPFVQDGKAEGAWEIIWTLDALDNPPARFIPALVDKLDKFDDTPSIYGDSSWGWILDVLNRHRKASLAALELKIADPDRAIRTCAAAALAKLSPNDDRLAPILIEGLKSEGLRGRAVGGLANLGPRAKHAIVVLGRGMEDEGEDNSAFRIQCAAAVARIAPADPVMLKFLERWRRDIALKEWPPKFLIVDELSGLGRVGVVNLMKLLDHPDDEIRRAAVETLGRIGPEASPALTMLIKMLKDTEQESLRNQVCDAIRDIGLDEQNVDEAPIFLELLHSEHGYLYADELVGRLGSGVIPDLMGIVYDRKAKLWTRVWAARALELIGDDAETAAPCVSTLLELHSNELGDFSKRDVIDVLGRIGKNCPDAALAVAAEFPKIPDSAGPALLAIGNPAIVPLTKWLAHDDAEVRTAVVKTLADFEDGTGTVRANLLQALKDPDCMVREMAATALGQQRHRSPEALVALLSAIADSRMPVRAAAARSLSGFERDAGQVAPALVGALHDDYLSVRVNACGSLGQLGRSAVESVPALERIAANDEFARARVAARDALRKIVPVHQ